MGISLKAENEENRELNTAVWLLRFSLLRETPCLMVIWLSKSRSATNFGSSYESAGAAAAGLFPILQSNFHTNSNSSFTGNTLSCPPAISLMLAVGKYTDL
jgi:hypothetical protein